MNGSNRGRNRIVLAILGLVLMGVGGAGVLAGTSSEFAENWSSTGAVAWTDIQQWLNTARIASVDISWWSVALLGALLMLAGLLVWWIASQGTGRSKHVAHQKSSAGATTVDTAVAAQAVKAALAGNPQILGTSVQAWKSRGAGGATGLKISVQARKGASPAEVNAAVGRVVEGMDQLLGLQAPVLVRIRAGARSKLARTQRVA